MHRLITPSPRSPDRPRELPGLPHQFGLVRNAGILPRHPCGVLGQLRFVPVNVRTQPLESADMGHEKDCSQRQQR